MSVEEHKQLYCEVCGMKGHKDTWYKEPYYDEYGKLNNKPYGERAIIGHREKIFYFPYGNGITVQGYNHRRLGITLCDTCHTIAPTKAKNSVFNTREEIHNHFDKQFKFRALAKNMEPISTSSTSTSTSTFHIPYMELYTHYNNNFEKGLIVKIPGSDNPQTKNNILKLSDFVYVMVTKTYPKETIPEWAGDTPFKSKSGINFDYYVEVIPYVTSK